MSDIKLTKAMTNEANKLGAYIDQIGQAGEQAQKAQESYCVECGKMGVKFSPEQCTAILEAMAGEDKKRQSKVSEGKKFSHPNVAPHVATLFALARDETRKAAMKDVSASIVARASKMATALKEVKATTPESAADYVANQAATKKANKATPEGAMKACKASIKKHMGEAQFTEEDLQPVFDALEEVVKAGPTIPEPEENVEQTGDAIEKAATSGSDVDLDALLAQSLENQRVIMAALAARGK